eukprot:RCo000378
MTLTLLRKVDVLRCLGYSFPPKLGPKFEIRIAALEGVVKDKKLPDAYSKKFPESSWSLSVLHTIVKVALADVRRASIRSTEEKSAASSRNQFETNIQNQAKKPKTKKQKQPKFTYLAGMNSFVSVKGTTGVSVNDLLQHFSASEKGMKTGLAKRKLVVAGDRVFTQAAWDEIIRRVSAIVDAGNSSDITAKCTSL